MAQQDYVIQLRLSRVAFLGGQVEEYKIKAVSDEEAMAIGQKYFEGRHPHWHLRVMRLVHQEGNPVFERE